MLIVKSNEKVTPSLTKAHEENKKPLPNPHPDTKNNVKEEKCNNAHTDKTENNGNTLDDKKGIECLNKACNGKHLLKDCPNTTDALKKELYRGYYSNMNNKPTVSSVKSPHVSAATNGKFNGKIEDTVHVVINGDYGADLSGISESHSRQCEQNGLFIATKHLETPTEVQLALCDPENPQVYISRKKARLSITLDLPIGPFRLRNVEFHVFKEELPQVILSRPLLQSIGFDLTKHLHLVRNSFHDMDFSHIGGADGEDTSAVPTGLSALLINKATTIDIPDCLPETSSNSTEVTSTTKQRMSTVSATNRVVGELSSNTFYGDAISEDTYETDDAMEIGEDNTTEVKLELMKRVDEAILNGLPTSIQEQLTILVIQHLDIFRLKLGHDPPARVPPLRIRLADDAKPVRAKCRNYTPPQRQFLKEKVDELLQLGLVRRNNESRWACAPLIVPKKGPELFRFTVDLRPLNSQTITHAWPMPHLEAISAQLSEDICFATIDLCHCYWQFPVSEESQELQSFITPEGVYTPTRILHGLTNAVAHVQSTVSQICIPIRDQILQWIDDMLIHCRTPQQLLQTLQNFFLICRTYNIKLHAKKCSFFLKEVAWCGRLISKDGIRLDPARINALTTMPPPTTAAQLQQFVCAANWMRMSIPQFNQLVEPLTKLLEDIYIMTGKRTRRSIQKILLSNTSWSDDHQQAFEAMKHAISAAVTLAHPSSTKQLCLFTDASEYHWSAILTQIPSTDINRPVSAQHHEPLAFLSGSFKGSSLRWSTIEKESYAIISAIRRLDYILARPEGFLIFRIIRT